MKNKDLHYSFLSALATIAYITLVAWVMTNGEAWFGEMETFWAPVMMLSLFVFSALVTGSLVLGRPVILYLDGEKKRALRSFIGNAVWLFGFVLFIFLVVAVR